MLFCPIHYISWHPVWSHVRRRAFANPSGIRIQDHNTYKYIIVFPHKKYRLYPVRYMIEFTCKIRIYIWSKVKLGHGDLDCIVIAVLMIDIAISPFVLFFLRTKCYQFHLFILLYTLKFFFIYTINGQSLIWTKNLNMT